MPATFELFQDPARSWRWRLRDADGHTIADGADGYRTASECRRVIQTVRQSAFQAELQETGPFSEDSPPRRRNRSPPRRRPTEAEPPSTREQKSIFNAAA